ncbi:NAD(P)/FAD-dependent oxidoreductase [Haloarcula sp. GH36]|uniref:NAD(P)/FAD-dependent oxidoreductase n=1 Tax=Haloarcula montana TaxID=3111776 RepID=UPI002D798A25|nr:FAD-binding oxidoreductase [Haloarcula sp. GH36]
MTVAVVGGGAVGLAIAGSLAERGATVTLYERDRLGSGTTGRAAGICYDAFADPVDAAVAGHAIDRYREWGLLTDCPYVWLARDADDAMAIDGQVDRMQSHGLAVSRLAPAELADRYPALDTETVVTAGIADDAGLLDPDAVVEFLAERARAAGAAIRTGTEVSLTGPRTVETPSGTDTVDAVVVAAGHATAPLVGEIGVPLALETYRAQALRTDAVGATLPALYDATAEFYWRPQEEGLLVGDGAHAATPEGWNSDADPSFVSGALERVADATTLSPTAIRSWAGLCTATPDRDPLVGAVAEGCSVATGWHGHGLMWAPAVGDHVASVVLGMASPLPEQFATRADPTRFDGDEAFDPLGDPTRDW